MRRGDPAFARLDCYNPPTCPLLASRSIAFFRTSQNGDMFLPSLTPSHEPYGSHIDVIDTTLNFQSTSKAHVRLATPMARKFGRGLAYDFIHVLALGCVESIDRRSWTEESCNIKVSGPRYSSSLREGDENWGVRPSEIQNQKGPSDSIIVPRLALRRPERVQ